MKFDDNGIYISTCEESERFVPWSVYKKVEEGVRNLRDNTKEFPRPVRWLLKKATKDINVNEHAVMSLLGLINSVEELGGKIVWEET